MTPLASALDDVAAVIGYRATRILQCWYSGRNLYIPGTARTDHPLVLLIGLSALRLLVEHFGGEHVVIPTAHEDQRFARYRRVADLTCAGWTSTKIAREVGLHRRRVEQIQAELVELRWIEYAGGNSRRWGRSAVDLTVGPENI